MAQVVKNLPANAGDIRDVGLTPGVGKIPWRRVAPRGQRISFQLARADGWPGWGGDQRPLPLPPRALGRACWGDTQRGPRNEWFEVIHGLRLFKPPLLYPPPARKWKVGHKIMPLMPLRGHDTEDKGGEMETIITGGVRITLLSPIIITIL